MNLFYTGETAKLPDPAAVHPHIEMFTLPPPLREPVVEYLAANPLESLATRQKIALALTLSECSSLAVLPDKFGTADEGDEPFAPEPPDPELVALCDRHTAAMVDAVTLSLLESARQGDIPATLSLLHITPPGLSAWRREPDYPKRELHQSLRDFSTEAHRLARARIADGNLFTAGKVTYEYIERGMFGLPHRRPDGVIEDRPERHFFVKGVAYAWALSVVTGEWRWRSMYDAMARQGSGEERDTALELARDLIANWMSKPVLYDSELKSQHSYKPGDK